MGDETIQITEPMLWNVLRIWFEEAKRNPETFADIINESTSSDYADRCSAYVWEKLKGQGPLFRGQ